ncbi:MAG: hypothetical protein GY845_08715 [Planctomycetes bacterium]|nr:hypothetical protein [Planctomycetota bacterium]
MKKEFVRGPSGTYFRHSVQQKDIGLKARLQSVRIPAFGFGLDLPPETSQGILSYATKDFDIRRLQGHQILLFGAGSVGSYIAWTMAQAQLTIHIFDSKKVESKHTQAGRTIYDTTQIGQLKVYAAQQKIENNFIGTKIISKPYNIAEFPNIELVNLFKQSSIVILVIDDPIQILRINQLAYSIVDIVQVGIHRQGNSGHIAFSIPNITPCLACTLGISSQRDIHRLDSEPASGVDISIVSQQAARIALDLMHSKATGKPITRWNPDQNLIYISNTQQDVTPGGPGIRYEGSQRRPDCPICR